MTVSGQSCTGTCNLFSSFLRTVPPSRYFTDYIPLLCTVPAPASGGTAAFHVPGNTSRYPSATGSVALVTVGRTGALPLLTSRPVPCWQPNLWLPGRSNPARTLPAASRHCRSRTRSHQSTSADRSLLPSPYRCIPAPVSGAVVCHAATTGCFRSSPDKPVWHPPAQAPHRAPDAAAPPRPGGSHNTAYQYARQQRCIRFFIALDTTPVMPVGGTINPK